MDDLFSGMRLGFIAKLFLGPNKGEQCRQGKQTVQLRTCEVELNPSLRLICPTPTTTLFYLICTDYNTLLFDLLS